MRHNGKAPAADSTDRRFVERVGEEVVVASPAEAAAYLEERVFHPWQDFDQEEVWVLLLTIKNRITHRAMVYRGAITGTHVRGAEIFKEAVRENAPAMILAHCHPSGDPEPSAEDVYLTRQLVEAARLLDISLLDHIIFAGERYTSMRERGLWGPPTSCDPPAEIEWGTADEG